MQWAKMPNLVTLLLFFLLIKLTRSTFNQVNPHQQRFISDLPVKTAQLRRRKSLFVI
jgi:hypothetical protein